MMELYAMWPIYLALAVIVAAGLAWCVCAVSPSHRPTRHVGILFCEDCDLPCDEWRRCPCCQDGEGT